MIVLLTIVAILAVVGLIIVAKVDPVISLVAGSLFLGLAAGLGFEKTLSTIVEGFGEIIVAHTDRDERIRIISAREVTAAERRDYAEEPK